MSRAPEEEQNRPRKMSVMAHGTTKCARKTTDVTKKTIEKSASVDRNVYKILLEFRVAKARSSEKRGRTI